MQEFVEALIQKWLSNMTTDVSRYAVFSIGVWLVLWVVLGGVLKHRKIRKGTPSARQMVIEFLISVRSISIFSSVSLLPFVLERAGWLYGPSWRRVGGHSTFG